MDTSLDFRILTADLYRNYSFGAEKKIGCKTNYSIKTN